MMSTASSSIAGQKDPHPTSAVDKRTEKKINSAKTSTIDNATNDQDLKVSKPTVIKFHTSKIKI